MDIMSQIEKNIKFVNETLSNGYINCDYVRENRLTLNWQSLIQKCEHLLTKSLINEFSDDIEKTLKYKMNKLNFLSEISDKEISRHLTEHILRNNFDTILVKNHMTGQKEEYIIAYKGLHRDDYTGIDDIEKIYFKPKILTVEYESKSGFRAGTKDSEQHYSLCRTMSSDYVIAKIMMKLCDTTFIDNDEIKCNKLIFMGITNR